MVQTIQILCGGCGNPMAVALEHLGAQVQCPYCQAVVQTPTSAHAPSPGPDLASPPQPQPPAVSALPDDAHAAKPSAHAFADGPTEHATATYEPADEAPSEEEEPVDIAAMRDRVRQARRASTMSATLLVYLVPFVICCTGFIAYLLYLRPSIDSFQWLAP
jgi:hypothetical protein